MLSPPPLRRVPVVALAAGARPVSLLLLRAPVPGRHRLTVRGLTRSAPVRETRAVVVPE